MHFDPFELPPFALSFHPSLLLVPLPVVVQQWQLNARRKQNSGVALPPFDIPYLPAPFAGRSADLPK